MRQDAAFYTNYDVVWEDKENPFYVLRCGEMRINAIDETGTAWIIRNTDQLEEFGIRTDEQLAEWSRRDESVFAWLMNPWFEICSTDDPDFQSESIHELDDAINQAKTIHKLVFNGEWDKAIPCHCAELDDDLIEDGYTCYNCYSTNKDVSRTEDIGN